LRLFVTDSLTRRLTTPSNPVFRLDRSQDGLGKLVGDVSVYLNT
jgi:hypothetical protein